MLMVLTLVGTTSAAACDCCRGRGRSRGARDADRGGGGGGGAADGACQHRGGQRREEADGASRARSCVPCPFPIAGRGMEPKNKGGRAKTKAKSLAIVRVTNSKSNNAFHHFAPHPPPRTTYDFRRRPHGLARRVRVGRAAVGT
jgi:hypothetical protein